MEGSFGYPNFGSPNALQNLMSQAYAATTADFQNMPQRTWLEGSQSEQNQANQDVEASNSSSFVGDSSEVVVPMRPAAELPEPPKTTPITFYKSDPVYFFGKQIAQNKNYICYSIRGGHLRVINKTTAQRALLRGHQLATMDVAFVSSADEDKNLMASVGRDGSFIVWNIFEQTRDDGVAGVEYHPVLQVTPVEGSDKHHRRVVWHPFDCSMLVTASSDSEVLVWNIPQVLSSYPASPVRAGNGEASCVSIERVDPCAITGVTKLTGHSMQVNDLAFSPSGRYMATAGADGLVILWDVSTWTPLRQFSPFATAPDAASDSAPPTTTATTKQVFSVFFCGEPGEQGGAIVTGGLRNSTFKIWSLESLVDPQSLPLPPLIQTVTISAPSTASNSADQQQQSAATPNTTFLGHADLDPSGQFLFVANSRQSTLHVVHLAARGKPSLLPTVNAVSEFNVKLPILSFVVTSKPSTRASLSISLFCVQTESIQLFSFLSDHLCGAAQQQTTATSASTTTEEPQQQPAAPEQPQSVEPSPPQQMQEITPPPPPTAIIYPGMVDFSTLAASSQPSVVTTSPEALMMSFAANVGPTPHNTLSPSVMSLEFLEQQISQQALDQPPQVLPMPLPPIMTMMVAEQVQQQQEGVVQPTGSNVIDVAELESQVVAKEDQQVSAPTTPAISPPSITATEGAQTLQPSTPEKTTISTSTTPPTSASKKAAAPTSGARRKLLPIGGENQKSVGGVNSDNNSEAAQVVAAALSTRALQNGMKEQKQVLERMESSLCSKFEKMFAQSQEALYQRMEKERAARERAERERTKEMFTIIAQTIQQDLPEIVERSVAKQTVAIAQAVDASLQRSLSEVVKASIAQNFVKVDKTIQISVEKAVTKQLAEKLPTVLQASLKDPLQHAFRQGFAEVIIPSFEQSCQRMFDQVERTFEAGFRDRVEVPVRECTQTARDVLTGESVQGPIRSLSALPDQIRTSTAASFGELQMAIAQSMQAMSANITQSIQSQRATDREEFNRTIAQALSQQQQQQQTPVMMSTLGGLQSVAPLSASTAQTPTALARQGLLQMMQAQAPATPAPSGSDPLLGLLLENYTLRQQQQQGIATPSYLTTPRYSFSSQTSPPVPRASIGGSSIVVPPTATPSAAAAQKTVFEMMAEVQGLITQQKFKEALSKALTCTNLDLMSWFSTAVQPKSVIAAGPEQFLIISAIQQFGSDLTSSASSKLQWILEFLHMLDPRDSHIASIVPSVLAGVLKSAEALGQSPATQADPSLTNLLQQVIFFLKFLTKGAQ